MRISDWSSDVCSSDLFLKLTPRGEMVLDTEYYSEEPVRVGGSGDDGEDDHGDDASGDGSAGSGSSHTPPAPPPEPTAPGGPKSVVQGTSVSVRVDIGGRRFNNKNRQTNISTTSY